MNALVIYDSYFGNTEKIAQAVAQALGSPPENQLLRISMVDPGQLSGLKLLVVGSPTRGFRPTEAISNLLKGLPAGYLKGTKVAAFDTRFTEEEIKSSGAILPFMVNIFGYAAKRIADKLKEKGGELVVPPEGFYVRGTEGPLLDGELDRAAAWASSLLSHL